MSELEREGGESDRDGDVEIAAGQCGGARVGSSKGIEAKVSERRCVELELGRKKTEEKKPLLNDGETPASTHRGADE